MKIHPSASFLLVEPITTEVRIRGLILPTLLDDRFTLLRARVIEPGPGANNATGGRKKVDFVTGDVVLYPQGAITFDLRYSAVGDLLESGNVQIQKAKLINAEDVICKVEGADVAEDEPADENVDVGKTLEPTLVPAS